MNGTVSVFLAAGRRLAGDLLAAACFEGEAPALEGLPPELARVAARILERPGWKGREKQVAEVTGEVPQVAVLALHGLGRRADFDGRKLEAWFERLAEEARTNGLTRLLIALPDHPVARGEAAAERIGRTLGLADYRFDRYMTRSEEADPRIERVGVVPPPGEEAAYRRGLAVAEATASAVAFARDLANTPGNEAGPDWMEARARELAESRGMKVKVIGAAELERRGMGGLVAVGAGSATKPRLVCLRLGAGEHGVALVGKGVTFDTGGISIKPAAAMDEMKLDKSGACLAMAVARAVADLELPIALRVYLPLAENMPDGAAYRPGDIIRCYNGKTVEITNTDAEGRLILADALSLAAEEGAETLLEYSTLTGASVIALGHSAAALYSPDDELAAALLAAAEESGERLWRMPLWPEYLEQMKGNHADLKNAGPRWGSANTAAAFLSQFVGGLTRWGHFDIAGPAMRAGEGKPEAGATGYGLGLTLAWLRRLAAAEGRRTRRR